MATVRDLLLDDDHDIALSGADLGLVSDGDAIRQAADIHLQFFAEEWFLDLTAGVPWFQSILVKNPNIPAITEIFKAELLSVTGILDVSQMGVSYTAATRTMLVNWSATSDLGELITSTVEVNV